MERKLICVQCPIGCHLTVTYDGVHEPVVTGNTCKNGENLRKERGDGPAPHADDFCTGKRRNGTCIGAQRAAHSQSRAAAVLGDTA